MKLHLNAPIGELVYSPAISIEERKIMCNIYVMQIRKSRLLNASSSLSLDDEDFTYLSVIVNIIILSVSSQCPSVGWSIGRS